MHKNRSRKKASLPTGLYEQNGYYRFKRIDGTSKGLGKNKSEAIKAAQWYNTEYRNSLAIEKVSVPVRTKKTIAISLTGFIDIFKEEIIPTLDWSNDYANAQITLLNKISTDILGKIAFESIQLSEISEFLSGNTPRMHNRYRSLLVQLYKYAMDRGIVSNNIAERKMKTRVGDRRRVRLSAELYNKIHALAPNWLKNAMDLALQTTHSRMEIAHMKFSDIKDGYIYLTRKKIEKYEHSHIAIPIKGELKKVIERCRDNLISPYLIHKPLVRRSKKCMKNRKHWTQVTPEQITREFSKIASTLDEYKNLKEDQTHPTFHEIRSLAIFLMEEQGYDAQASNS